MTKNINTQLIEAVSSSPRNIEEIKKILINGACVNTGSKLFLGSPLMRAACKGDVGIMRFLLDNGADINFQSEQSSYNALMLAVVYGKIPAINFLIENNADLNLQTNEGLSALMLAVLCNKLTIVRILKEAGADVSLKNKRDETAADMASLPSIKKEFESEKPLSPEKSPHWKNSFFLYDEPHSYELLDLSLEENEHRSLENS